MVEALGRRLSLRAREITGRGQDALVDLPSAEHLADLSGEERHHVLEGLRTELYALSSIVADATVRRALRERPAWPPYGLVRSRHSELRLVSADPDPVEEGSIDSFLALGKAYVDTTVFHLHRQFEEQLQSDQGWVLRRLEQLLTLFRVGAGPATRARMRDASSFVYGGLHFGSGVCVQLVEVMARVLDQRPSMTAADKAEVIARSSRPAFQLAALNVEHVIPSFQRLQSPAASPAGGGGGQSWMDPGRFVVEEAEGRPWRIELADEAVIHTTADGRRLEDLPTLYATQGCPGRISPAGGPSPIALLWSWCVELARDLQLLGPVTPDSSRPTLEPGSAPGPA